MMKVYNVRFLSFPNLITNTIEMRRLEDVYDPIDVSQIQLREFHRYASEDTNLIREDTTPVTINVKDDVFID
jgi:hypothetical protein